MVELVKESVPFAEKNPFIESAWATAALLIAKAVNTTKRLSMVGLREQFAAQEIHRAAFKEMLRRPESVGQHIQIKILRFVPQFKRFLRHQTVVLYHLRVQLFA